MAGKKQFRFYDPQGIGALFDLLGSDKPGDTLAAIMSIASAVRTNAVAQVDAWQETPFGIVTNKPDPPDQPPRWQVYGSNITVEGSAVVKVSNVGELIIGPDADDTQTVTGRMEPGTCNDGNILPVAADYLVYIHIQTSVAAGVISIDSAAVVAGDTNALTGWDDYPALVQWDTSDEQTDLFIPLSYVEDVSKDNWASVTREGDFTLLPGCLGLYQLAQATDIAIKLETYLGRAALMPYPLPAAI